MTDSSFAILDPAAGISGDMLLGALIGAGAPVAWLEGLPARLGFPEVSVRVRPVDRAGVTAMKVDVLLPGGQTEQVESGAGAAGHAHAHGSGHDHAHGHVHHPMPHTHARSEGHAHHGDHGHDHHHHDHHGHGPHRHLGDLLAIVDRAPLSPWVRARARRAFELLGEAEGRVHGCAPEAVALHEVAALDAVVDIVGGVEGFEQLGITRIHHRPVAVGNGWVRGAHGVMAVPAPATTLLLEGIEIGPDGPVQGEATTPTGAALLRALSEGPAPARWRHQRTAWGAGSRNPGHYANVLRLLVATTVAEAGEVTCLATDLDDLSPEYVEPLREALAEAGALDVQCWPTQMKKGRPGFRLEAIALPADADRVAQALLRHSTSGGLRRWRAERQVLARRELALPMDGGPAVRVKLLDAPGGVRAKPEYEDVAALARRTGRPAHELARELTNRALAEAGAPVPHPES